MISGAKLEHMLALREEVEQEYADRMEELREMYRDEMDSQNEKFEAEKAKMRMLETSLQVCCSSQYKGRFVEQKLELSCIFRLDQIRKNC
jgi:hypothetical protein